MEQADNFELMLQALEHAVVFDTPEWASKARGLVRDLRDPDLDRTKPTLDLNTPEARDGLMRAVFRKSLDGEDSEA